MFSLFSLTAGANVRWHDLPGKGIPVVFIHGLGCSSSYEYPRVVADPAFGGQRAILMNLLDMDSVISLKDSITAYPIKLKLLLKY